LVSVLSLIPRFRVRAGFLKQPNAPLQSLTAFSDRTNSTDQVGGYVTLANRLSELVAKAALRRCFGLPVGPIEFFQNVLVHWVRVSKQHPHVSVPTDKRDLWDVEAPLKKATYRFMSQIVKPKAPHARSPSQTFPSKPNGICGNGKDPVTILG
jgi:hypothetical protein